MLIEAKHIQKTYKNSRGIRVEAVKDASLRLEEGQTVGLLGSSGSGKSTIGQMLVGQFPPDRGEILYRGQPLKYPYRGAERREIQILYQHPEVSFNPRLTLLRSMIEPYRLMKRRVSRETLIEDIRQFGLYAEHLDRFPGELSGGELQRAALARILVMEPRMIVLDEPTSMLDVISQAQIIALLRTLQAEQGLGFLFISHDIELSRMVCERIHHLENGVIAETENCRRAAQPT